MRQIAILTVLLLTSAIHAADPAWIEYGPNGPVARTIVTSATCPRITIDGHDSAMTVHAVPVQHYQVTVCEALLPAGVRTASIGAAALSVGKLGRATKVAILGDTGCRIKVGKDGKPPLIQDCRDPSAWPFPTIIQSIAAWDPDVVLHVGDYYYREATCSDDDDCKESTFNWRRWNEDFFTPAAPLLASTPWVVARGNHEECKRAAEGWFRFLDPRDYVWEDVRTCKSNLMFTPPYVVAIGALSLGVVDSSATKSWDAEQATIYAGQLALMSKAASGTWLIQHHPLWAIDDKTPVTKTMWTAWDQAGAAMSPIGLVVTGHIHTLEALSFTDQTVPQVVAGVGGTQLSKGAEEGAGTVIGTRTVASIAADDDFGFIAATPTAEGWTFDVRTTTGKSLKKCAVTKSAIVCE